MNKDRVTEIQKQLYELLVQVIKQVEPGGPDERDVSFSSGDNLRIHSVSDLGEEFLQIYDQRNLAGRPINTITTGFAQLDELIGGFSEGELIVIGSRPGIGKTSAILSMTSSQLKDSLPVAIYSLELGRQALMDRLISIHTRIPVAQLWNGKLTPNEFRKVRSGIVELLESKFYIIEGTSFDPVAFADIFKGIKEKHGIKILYVDYLQLLISNKPRRNREQEISDLMRSFKSLALEMKIPVVIASQMNRYVEWRGGAKRPFLSDLRESGSIEEIADKVLFVYRAEAFGITMNEEGNSTAGLAELIVGKNRMGLTGECTVKFEKNYGLFENINWDKNIFPSLELPDNPFNEGPF